MMGLAFLAGGLVALFASTAHSPGGELRRNLAAVGPREPVLTTLARADELVGAGFRVIAPLESDDLSRVTAGRFDDYVRASAARAVWLFLPQDDSRVARLPPVARDGGYVLGHATSGGDSR